MAAASTAAVAPASQPAAAAAAHTSQPSAAAADPRQQPQNAGAVTLLLLRLTCLLLCVLLGLLRHLCCSLGRCCRLLILPPLPPTIECVQQRGWHIDRLCSCRILLADSRLRHSGAVDDCNQLAATHSEVGEAGIQASTRGQIHLRVHGQPQPRCTA